MDDDLLRRKLHMWLANNLETDFKRIHATKHHICSEFKPPMAGAVEVCYDVNPDITAVFKAHRERLISDIIADILGEDS